MSRSFSEWREAVLGALLERWRPRFAAAIVGAAVVVLVVALWLLPGRCVGGAGMPDASILPGAKAAAGCVPAEPSQQFVGADLYKLIDGGAPRFLDKGFLWAVAGAYECSSGRVAIEVYRMKATAGARAVFDEQAGAGGPAGVGDASRVSAGFLEFIRGSFYVTVTGFEPGPKVQADIVGLAQQVDEPLIKW